MTRYSERERDWAYMSFVKAQPCALRGVDGAGDCGGPVQAAHCGDVGVRALSHRSGGDETCAPLCRDHHGQRDERRGFFAGWDDLRLRAWSEAAYGACRRCWEAWRAGPVPF